MKTLSAEMIFALLATIIFLSSCGSSEEINGNISASDTAQNAAQANLVKDDIGELGKIINLPFEPLEVVWQESSLNNAGAGNRVSAPNEKRLIAVLQFTPEEANRLIAQAEKYAQANPSVIDAESWFPVELIAQSQLSGDETLKGNSYAADDFFMESLNKGKLTHITDTNYFVLELTSF